MGKVIGYTQGTFDMFHIGHLNLIRNAKMHCDYLIVGVNADALVESYKHKKPIVPLEERAEIVRAIRYVDQVIITDTLDKREIWNKIRFDEIYIGDDWKGNERWRKQESRWKNWEPDWYTFRIQRIPHQPCSVKN